jgi:uncharacterized protein YciI
MKALFLTAFLFALCGLANAQNPTPAPSAAPAKQTYLVVYKPGPKWLAGKPVAEQPLKEHFKYMVSLYNSGTMRFAGPFSKDAGGAVCFEAENEAEALKVVKTDPAVINQIFVFELNRWDLVQWDKYVKK